MVYFCIENSLYSRLGEGGRNSQKSGDISYDHEIYRMFKSKVNFVHVNIIKIG